MKVKKMVRTFAEKLLSSALSLLLVANCGTVEAVGQQPAPAGSEQGTPLSANELQQLVAPIALYPDAVVAQVLGAATFPDQVQAANNWLQQNKSLTGDKLMKAGVTINRPPRDGHMAFVRSPEGISIELLQDGGALPPAEPWTSMPNTGSW